MVISAFKRVFRESVRTIKPHTAYIEIATKIAACNHAQDVVDRAVREACSAARYSTAKPGRSGAARHMPPNTRTMPPNGSDGCAAHAPCARDRRKPSPVARYGPAGPAATMDQVACHRIMKLANPEERCCKYGHDALHGGIVAVCRRNVGGSCPAPTTPQDDPNRLWVARFCRLAQVCSIMLP